MLVSSISTMWLCNVRAYPWLIHECCQLQMMTNKELMFVSSWFYMMVTVSSCSLSIELL